VNTQRLYDYVLESVFGVYLLDPEALGLRLTEVKTSLRVTAAGLEFNLPDLYDFASLEAKVDGDVKGGQSYTSFRSCLYGQQTQVMLRQLGGEVVIAKNYEHVNMSIYRLQALT
jgi:hypothetical protein|tara:strand:+ start:3691 stop:4032 length:342 start_codon:yes stop_codon:yes gene_type:complete